MQARVKKLVVLLSGWCFILLGVIGLFLPVLQGVLFLLIGLFILSSEYIWAHRILQKLRSRCPTLAHQVDEASRKCKGWLHKLTKQEAGEYGATPSGAHHAVRDPGWMTNVTSAAAGSKQESCKEPGKGSSL